MPSPIGHMIAGATAGMLVSGSTSRLAVVTFSLIAASPDLDLLFGIHSGPTHGLGSAVLAGAAAWLLARAATRKGDTHQFLRELVSVPNSAGPLVSVPNSVAAAAACAYATHTLLDWLSTDTTAPIGIMALWPFRHEYYESSLHIFHAISRRYWLPDFWLLNLRALIRELLILVPLLWIAWWLRRERP